MTIVQISDLHIGAPGWLAFGRIDTAENLARCVAHIGRIVPPPEAVVASGDLADTGAAEEYRRLRRLLAPLSMPVYLMPGNHDERAALRMVFRDNAYLPPEGTVNYAIDSHVVRLIMLDTVVPGADEGALDARQLEWLSATLSEAGDKPVHIFMHHPPIMSGLQYMDEIALVPSDREALAAIVARHPRVERISCGHVHRGLEALWHGTTVSLCPSTAFQLAFGIPAHASDIASDEPPAYQVHYWNGSQLVTHIVNVSG